MVEPVTAHFKPLLTGESSLKWTVMRRLLPVFVLLLIFTGSVAAKEWRGILPLHSTRAEVEALLGPAPILRGNKPETDLSIYSLDEGEVRIVFADEKFLNEHPCSPISVGTVLRIEVVPKDEIPLGRFVSDEKLFRKFEVSDPPDSNYEGFVDEKEGFVVRAYRGMAQALYYLPSDTDRARCSALYQKLEDYALIRRFVCGIRMKFDEYGNLSDKDEKAAGQLRDPNTERREFQGVHHRLRRSQGTSRRGAGTWQSRQRLFDQR